jgi:hypothetical protein
MVDDEMITATLRDSFGLAVRDLEPAPGLLAQVRRRHRSRSRVLVVARLLTPTLAGALFVGLVALRPTGPPNVPTAKPVHTLTSVNVGSADPTEGPLTLSGVAVRLAGFSFATPADFVRSATHCGSGPLATTFAAASGPGGCIQVSMVEARTAPNLTMARQVLVGQYKGFVLYRHAPAILELLVVVPKPHGYAYLTVSATSLSWPELLAIARSAVSARHPSTRVAPCLTRCGASLGAS